jgi:hypothetical protein
MNSRKLARRQASATLLEVSSLEPDVSSRAQASRAQGARKRDAGRCQSLARHRDVCREELGRAGLRRRWTGCLRRMLTFPTPRASKLQPRAHGAKLLPGPERGLPKPWRLRKALVFAQSRAETRHNLPSAFTMHQGPVPTQLCCGTSKLGGKPDQDEGIA